METSTTENKEKLSRFICITQHAIDRFCEVVPEVENVPDERIKGTILAMYRDGDKFGGQHGKDFFIKGIHNSTGKIVIFPCTPGKGNSIIVKTVLPFEVAMANMQTIDKALWKLAPNDKKNISRASRKPIRKTPSRSPALVPDDIGNRWDPDD